MVPDKDNKRIRVGTVWLCGCAGCHMSFLDLDEKLIDLAELVEVVASPIADVKEMPECDVALVEGGVANEENLHVLQTVRQRARILVSLGDCAGFGCIPMLRNLFSRDDVLDRAYVEAESNALGAVPQEEVPRLADKVRPIHEHVKVDAWIPGCPPSAEAIWSKLSALLAGAPAAEHVRLRYD